MVTLNKIYTRAGDGGTTRLATGEEIAKDAPRVEAYGAVDETNAAVGVARIALAGTEPLEAILARVQNELFDVGADLATPGPDEALGFEPLRATEAQVTRLEHDIDTLNGELEPLKSFVLPAGHTGSVALHMARTICRRAERRATSLLTAEPERVNAVAVIYLNRLSDLLFVAARFANHQSGDGDVLWTPGATREG